jgi:hypothetical protein
MALPAILIRRTEQHLPAWDQRRNRRTSDIFAHIVQQSFALGHNWNLLFLGCGMGGRLASAIHVGAPRPVESQRSCNLQVGAIARKQAAQRHECGSPVNQRSNKSPVKAFRLEPVSFRYKEEIDPNGIPQFGLVEQVKRSIPS